MLTYVSLWDDKVIYHHKDLKERHSSNAERNGNHMKLIDGNEVAALLGISKSTLFRWCDISEASDDARTIDVVTTLMNAGGAARGSRAMQWAGGVREETPKDFPRPFKIGRAYKWSDEEIMQWLEKKRV